MRIQSIHKKVFKRLFFGWVLLSIAIGGAVYYLESKKVDQLVLGLALTESHFFTGELA